ncbi:hypothetical protein HY58_01575 [Flavihumibacter sp. ZG627]|nr:hypothetical protein HY58_01575 [Flavihumibacter sp. ZG627]
MAPKVSILIPVYNSEKYLRQTIESALNQTWKNIELIIVDDGSTDSSLGIARQFESDKVKVLSTINQGACNARNLAFSQSSGDYIQYLDGDDLLSAKKLEEQISLLGSSGRAISSCKWVRFYNDHDYPNPSFQHTYKSYDKPADLLLDLWSHQEMMQTSVWLAPREIILEVGPWNTSLRINQDGEFFGRVMLRSSGVLFAENSLVYYRSGVNNSITHKPRNREIVSSLLRSYTSLESEIFKIEKSERVYKALSYIYSSFIYHYNNLYPDLANTARNKLQEWRLKPMISVGGSSFVRVSSVIGFYNTLRLRKLLSGN